MGTAKVGDYLIAGLGGAAGGFLANQEQENDAARVAKEQERQVQLLMLKEKLTAAREERKAGIEHGYKMNELGAKNKFDADENSKNRAAKIVEAGEKTEFDRWKTEQDNTNRLSVANINAEARKSSASSRGGSGDEKAIRGTQARLRKEYKRDVKDWEINNPGETAPDFDSWANENYPEDYDFAFPGGGASESSGSGAAPSTKGESKLDSIFNEYGASRTKKGANDGKQQMPAATGEPGDIIEPQPISVDRGGNVTSAAPTAGRGTAQAASGHPPVDELPMKQGAAAPVSERAPLDVGKSWAAPAEKDSSFLKDIVAAILEFGGRNATGGKNEIIAQLREKYPNMTDKMLELEYQKVLEQMRGKDGKTRFKTPEL